MYKLRDMQKIKYGICLVFLTICMQIQVAVAQTYKAGDRLEANIGNVWKEATVVKAVAGKPDMYEIKAISNTNRGAALLLVVVSKNNLRVINKKSVVIPAPVVAPLAESSKLHLGMYEFYSGIPTMYIGHVILLSGGKYKVAFSTAENDYEIGLYLFHEDTSTIEWLTGMFKHNNWGGKLVNRLGSYRIEFNYASYANSN